MRTHARVGRAQIRPCGWSTTVRPETPRALVADRTPERHPALRAPEDPHTVFRRRARTVAAHLPGMHDGHPAERRAREIYQTSTTSTDRTAPTALVDHALSSDNLMYAIRIKGTFGEVRTRTVMRQPPPCLHGASLPLLPARAPVVLRRPADSGGWPFPVRWPPPWCGPGPTFCPSPATAASSSAHRLPRAEAGGNTVGWWAGRTLRRFTAVREYPHRPARGRIWPAPLTPTSGRPTDRSARGGLSR